MVQVPVKIKRLLLDSGLVSEEHWNHAKSQGPNILENLLESGGLEPRVLIEAMSRSSNVPPVDLERVKPDSSAVEYVTQEACFENRILPLTINGEVLTLAVCDPFDVLLLDDLRRRTGCEVRQMVTDPLTMSKALESVFQTGRKQVDDLLDSVTNLGDIEVKEQADDQGQDDLAHATADGDDAPAVKLANLVLLRALRDKASDIHIEPTDSEMYIRFRVDGRMRLIMTPPKGLLNALISRLKILAQLDIAERFKPQDGKFQIKYEGRQIDFRLSILPVVGGEKAVMRILDAGNLALKLETMGYEPKALSDIRRAIDSPYGMMLITGPTGSGKSTTLYSCVQEVATPEINVTTVEDPVEYRMQGINQVPVNPKRGLTFAGALRSILRQDPDVVLVGEIRDTETAEIAVKAALTGHLVLSTLHTNDAASTITRLVDMGIDPFMVSSSLLCIGAQRLGRKLCESCRVPIEVPEKELLNVGYLPDEIPGMQLFGPGPQGCPRCNAGYKGRFAILETLFLEDSIKRMVVEGRNVLDIKKEAIAQGMISLRRAALLNAKRGRTSLQEVLRVTIGDD
ncbi:MAG: Flp pilus assembly complex ATPase component TadA [Planctomycetes bacterium]|nr:Flp pilus assembly complex ATPase component TadA [Planctomycetota bacterium]MCB9905639.1 Flp pilus assembly complex ATPase component TadA [Planctomycetota bacterium]